MHKNISNKMKMDFICCKLSIWRLGYANRTLEKV